MSHNLTRQAPNTQALAALAAVFWIVERRNNRRGWVTVNAYRDRSAALVEVSSLMRVYSTTDVRIRASYPRARE